MIKKQLTVSGLHCVNCSLLIEEELADIGVSAKANYAKQTVDVVYDDAKISDNTITQVIKKLGYKVVHA